MTDYLLFFFFLNLEMYFFLSLSLLVSLHQASAVLCHLTSFVKLRKVPQTLRGSCMVSYIFVSGTANVPLPELPYAVIYLCSYLTPEVSPGLSYNKGTCDTSIIVCLLLLPVYV